MARQGARRIVLDRAGECLGVLNVPFHLWKGMDFAFTLYDDPTDRPMTDVDLLVPLCHAGEAWSLLKAGGFKPCASSRALFTGGLVGEAKFTLGGVLLELHTHPLYYPSILPGRLPRVGSLSNLRKVGRCTAPAWPDAMLFTAIHHAVSEPLKPYQALDMRLMAPRLTPSDWERFARNAFLTGWGRGILGIMEHCGVVAPPGVRNALSAGKPPPKLPRGTVGALRSLRGWRLHGFLWAMFHRTVTGKTRLERNRKE